MRLAAAPSAEPHSGSEIETIYLSPEHAEFIERLSTRINPDMPLAFGSAHVVRMLLEQIEETHIELASASADEVATAAAAAQRQRRGRR